MDTETGEERVPVTCRGVKADLRTTVARSSYDMILDIAEQTKQPRQKGVTFAETVADKVDPTHTMGVTTDLVQAVLDSAGEITRSRGHVSEH